MTAALPARRLHRTAGLYAAVRLAGQGTEFLAFLVFARRLGATEFGRLAVPFLICRYAGLLADWGAHIRGTREVAEQSRSTSVGTLVVRRYQATAVLVTAYVVACLAIGRPEIAPLGATIAARGLSRDWLALGREQVMRSGITSVIQGCGLVLGVLFVRDLSSAAVVIAVAYLASTAYSIAVNRLPPQRERSRLPLRQANWILVATLADQVCLTADTILLSVLRSATDAGVYAAIYRLPNAWMTLMGLLTTGILPGLTRHVRQDPSLEQYLRRRALRGGALAASLILVLLPPSVWLVPYLFGPDYIDGRAPLAILLLASAVVASTVALVPFYWATRPDRTFALWYSAAATANLLGNLLLIPPFGMIGAAFVVLGTSLVLSAFLIVTTHRSEPRVASAGDDEKLRHPEVAQQRSDDLLES